MFHFDRRGAGLGFHTFHTVPSRYGTRKALGDKGVPYLHTFHTCFLPRVRVGACRRVHTQARTPAYARAHLPHFTYGRYGRYGRRPQRKGSEVPYLFHTSARYGR